MMKKGLILSLICIIFVATGCKKKEKVESERIVSVNVMVVNEETFGEKRTYVGTIEASEAITLSFESGGNVKDVYVKVGDNVYAGQLLASLAKNSAQSSYDAAKSTLEQAEDGYQRAKQLHDNGSLPEVKWVEIQTKLAQAQSMENIARNTLEHCDLYSPASGVIGNKMIEQGTNVSPLQQAFKLMNIRQLKVRTSIPENEISKIKIGKKAFVVVPAADDESFEAEVIERGIEANVLSHSYDVKCIFTGKHEKLLPGMVCKVTMDEPENVGFVVPSRAVQTMSGGIGVWKIENGHAKRCLISSNKYVSDGVLVLEGLSKGDTIVTEGYQKLFDNAKVEINKVTSLSVNGEMQ